MERKNEGRKPKGMKAKLLLLALLPAFIVGLLLFVISTNKMSNSLSEVLETRVENVCNALAESYESLYEGDLSYDGSSFTKGEKDLYDTYELIDKIHEEDDVQVTIFYGDTRIMTTVRGEDGERFVNTKAGEQAIETVLNKGETYHDKKTVINGEKYYSYYRPIKNSDGAVVGMFFVGIPTAKITNDINNAALTNVIALIVLLAIAAAIVIYIAWNFIKTIQSCASSVVTMAEGDLNVEAKVGFFNKGDELDELAHSINDMANRFRGVTGEVRSSADVMNEDAATMAGIAQNTHTSIDEVSRAIEDVAYGATKQAADTQDTVSSMEDMSQSIEKIVEEVNELSSAADNTQATSEGAKKVMEELLKINEETNESVEKIVIQSEINVNAAARIQQVVNVISDIASQTSLLSLNASIEAARAGEQGKGFSVVALEVGQLAQESSKSAAEIETIIQELVENISKTSDLTDVLNVNTKQQIEKLETTQKNFNTVLADVNLMFEKTLNVQAEIMKINEIRLQIEDVIQSLSALSQENAAASEETTASIEVVVHSMEELNASTQEISELATKLTEVISYFHEYS